MIFLLCGRTGLISCNGSQTTSYFLKNFPTLKLLTLGLALKYWMTESTSRRKSMYLGLDILKFPNHAFGEPPVGFFPRRFFRDQVFFNFGGFEEEGFLEILWPLWTTFVTLVTISGLKTSKLIWKLELNSYATIEKQKLFLFELFWSHFLWVMKI